LFGELLQLTEPAATPGSPLKPVYSAILKARVVGPNDVGERNGKNYQENRAAAPGNVTKNIMEIRISPLC
jgi:hypothetical protein